MAFSVSSLRNLISTQRPGSCLVIQMTFDSIYRVLTKAIIEIDQLSSLNQKLLAKAEASSSL
jgi:hypothetical protein